MAVDIQFNVDQALAKLGDLVAKHGPQAVDLAAQVVHMNGVAQMVGGAVAAVIAAAAGVAAVKLGRSARRECEKPYSEQSEFVAVGGIVGAVITAAISIVATGVALAQVSDTWAWVALFNPKLALAHQVLAKFAGL